ncbi:protein IMPACT-like [Spodoptera frugiperda]|uniref:Protein IMPACT-like n=1 Tax=Spodoptera frugiperda TaxID=7108 RepID=A0A9R0DW63_SPOFR|nr:protein IMPACT-like [Spodoptera frugiperda]
MENINLLKQGEEREALASIYEKEFEADSSGTGSSYCIKVQSSERNNEAVIHVTMPRDYPSESPPVYVVSAPWMDRKTKERLHHSLDQIYKKHKGEIIVFRWVEEIRNFLFSVESRQERNKRTERKKVKSRPDEYTKAAECPDITHGEVITDRKSSFQGHAARVGSVDDVKAVLSKLKMHRKIVNAKHNMVAYRIEHRTAKGVEIVQGYDEDGEAHAGGRLLHLLQTNNCLNTAVVVTRWFGGIQIGGDRFRHITNAAKQAIQQAGLLNKT